ncbi:hypothetical protein ABT404_09610 [Streptomyces hyaluromycini]|uniref:Calcium-binding protein n=1 Tax=Streptomyces hyaluromycini TaxID=1377993 RepID=A0ABV1WS99_9ACTN
MRAGRSSGSAVVLAGALALGVFAAPSAAAADTGITVTDMVVNKGRPIVVGTSATVKPGFTFRMTWPSGVELPDAQVSPFLYHDTTAAKGDADGGIYISSVGCGDNGSQPADCGGQFYIEPRYTLDSNNDATTWKIAAGAKIWGPDDKLKSQEILTGLGTVRVLRAAKVTSNATPEPVAKGRTLTVKGAVTRADWVKHKYVGFGGKSAKLQFRAKGSGTYTTLKIVQADSAGALKTTVKASADGYYRWTFGATSTTGGATSAGDYVDVR